MHVHQLAAFGGDLAQQLHAGRTVRHGAFEMRDAAHHVHAQVECALDFLQATGCAQHAVLRECDELQVDVRRHAALDLQQRLHGQHAGVAGVHVRADGQQPARHGPVAVSQRAFDQRFLREQGFEFAPQRDALEQRAAVVDARQAVA